MATIIPKEEPSQQPPLLPKIVFYSGVIFFLFCIALGTIMVFQVKRIEKEIQVIDQQLTQYKTEEIKNQEEELKIFQNKLLLLTDLLNKHQQPTKIFDQLFTKTIHPQVILKEITLNAEANLLEIIGSAANYAVIGEQLKIFEEFPGVKKVNLKGTKIDKDGRLQFTVDLFLQPNFLNYSSS